MTAKGRHLSELERKQAKTRKAEVKREKAEERAGLVTYDAATGAIVERHEVHDTEATS